MRCVRVTIVAVEKQWVLHVVCVCVCEWSLRYPAFNAHAPHCHLWPAPLDNTFPHYHKLHDFRKEEKKSYWAQNVFWFSLQLLSETFLILRRNERDMIKMYIGLHVKCRLFLAGFNETWIFSTDIRKKSSNIKFRENPSCGSRVVPCGRTDRQDEANRRFSQFCERA